MIRKTLIASLALAALAAPLAAQVKTKDLPTASTFTTGDFLVGDINVSGTRTTQKVPFNLLPAVTSATAPLSLTGGTLSIATGTTGSTVAIGNDTRFPASVTGLRLGAGAGSADTAATIGSGLQLVGGTLSATGTLSGITGLVKANGGTPSAAASGDAIPLNPADLSYPPRLWLRADSARAVGNGNAVTTWGDQSGNGYNATGTGSPLYIASGINSLPVIRFSGSAKMATGSGCTVTANNYTGFMVAKVTSHTIATQANLFSWTSNNHHMIASGGAGALDVGLYDTGGYSGYMWLPLNTPFVLSWISSPSGIQFRVNGQSLYDGFSNPRQIGGLGPASSLGSTTINTANIFNNQFSQITVGDLAETIIYPAALTPGEVAGVEAYLASRYALTVRNNFAITKRVVLFGDSRSCPTNAAQGAGASTLSSLRNALGLSWLVLTAGISGNTPAQMAARVETDVTPFYDANLSKNVCVILGGVNALAAGTSGSTIYTNLMSCVSAARTAGYKVALCTELQNTDLSGPQETQRQALNTLIRATAVPGSVDAIIDTDAGLGSGQPTHPSSAAGITIANTIAAVVTTL